MAAKLEWEWKFSPQTVISLTNLVVMVLGVIGVFYKLQSDVQTQATKTDMLQTTMTGAIFKQSEMSERLVKVETKVDLLLPSVQRIEQSLRTVR